MKRKRYSDEQIAFARQVDRARRIHDGPGQTPGQDQATRS